MAITDIISEEIETRAPNMEIAQGGPEDFMTDDEMDPYQDPEFQQLLESLPGEQAEVLMQLIKEFKAMVAQGFKGEFEDFVKMKMASAQGGPEEFMSEEEMQIGPEEQQSLIPMGQQVAQGGRIGYDQGGGIMDVVAEEQVERGPTNQEIIMKWLSDRGLPITPENIQRAIMELSQAGQSPAMTRPEGMNIPQMDRTRPPTGEGYVPEELIGQDISETVTPDVASMRIAEEVVPEDDVYSDQEMIDMKQDYIDKGGTLDKASWGIEDDVEETGIMQIDEPIKYTDDEDPYTRDMFKESANVLTRGMYGMPDSREYLQEEIIDRINRYKRHNPDATDEEIHEILRGEKYDIDNLLRQQSAKDVPFTLAQGGRIGYQYGNQVTADAPGVRSQVSPYAEGNQMAEKALNKIILDFYRKFPEASEEDIQQMIRNYIAEEQFEGVMGTEGAGILDIHEGAKMITPESITKDVQRISRGDTQWGDLPYAQGGRIGYQYGNQVTADAPGIMSQVPDAQAQQIEQSQMFEEAYNKIMRKFSEKFPGVDSSEMRIEDMVAELQAEGVSEHATDILSFAAGMDMITPEGVRSSTPVVMRGLGDQDYLEHQFDHPVDEIRGRPGYGLGSLVKSVFKGGKKLVKSLTKSVKKFAKSDLGKAALMYIATAGMGNILQPGAASWASPFTKGAGTGWLRPGTVLSNYGNLFKGSPEVSKAAGKLTSSAPITADAAGVVSKLTPASEKLLAAKNAGSGSGMFSGLLGSFKSNPMPWILGTSGAAGLYTKMNPGDDNLDELMRNYAGEEADWDQRIADIRAGKIQTPFSADNITYPYPNYYQLADGGRIGRAEGGLMDLGGMEKDYRAEGGFVPIGGKEKADDVPARLSRNEFVFTADAVRNAGGGDVDRGAEVMENVMTNLEQGGNISEESQGLEGARDMFEVSERLSEVV